MGLMASLVAAAVAVLRVWRRNHVERRELASLPPHQRYELGFVGEVDLEINKPFWRR